MCINEYYQIYSEKIIKMIIRWEVISSAENIFFDEHCLECAYLLALFIRALESRTMDPARWAGAQNIVIGYD